LLYEVKAQENLTVPILGAIIPSMGTYNRKINSGKAQSKLHNPTKSKYSVITDALFSSTQKKLLTIFFSRPERSFYTREIIALVDSGSGAVQRELNRLGESGVLTVKTIGNQKHYQANAESSIFSEIQGIVIKSFGIVDTIRYGLQSLKADISCAFIYGSLAKGTMHARSDIDIMLIADNLTLSEIFSVIKPIELQLEKNINPIIYKKDEFFSRIKTKNHFLTKVLEGDTIPLIGDVHAFKEIR